MKFYLPSQKNSQSGQVILIVLLVISVLLVVGLSVVSRSVTDIKISQQSQESARALWVAMAGLEKAIKANAGLETSVTNNIENWVERKEIGGGSTELVFPGGYQADESITLWLLSHNGETGELIIPSPYAGPTELSFSWGQSETPALEATLVYQSGGNFFAKRYAYAPLSRLPATNFTQAQDNGCSVSGTSFLFCSDNNKITVPGGVIPYFVHLRLLFNEKRQPLGVKANVNFPIQGYCFRSTAKVKESDIIRVPEECRLWPAVPSIFDRLLYSGGDIK